MGPLVVVTEGAVVVVTVIVEPDVVVTTVGAVVVTAATVVVDTALDSVVRCVCAAGLESLFRNRMVATADTITKAAERSATIPLRDREGWSPSPVELVLEKSTASDETSVAEDGDRVSFVQFEPSQYRSSAEPRGSSYHPAGMSGILRP